MTEPELFTVGAAKIAVPFCPICIFAPASTTIAALLSAPPLKAAVGVFGLLSKVRIIPPLKLASEIFNAEATKVFASTVESLPKIKPLLFTK